VQHAISAPPAVRSPQPRGVNAFVAVAAVVCAALIGGSPSAVSQPAAPPAASIPVADFVRHPAIWSVSLSPSTKRLAMILPGPDGRRVLAVADTATPDKRIGVARFDRADVSWAAWVNDERLVFSAANLDEPAGRQVDSGLYAVNADGTGFTWLIDRQQTDEGASGSVANRPLLRNHRFSATIHDGSDDVLITRWARRYAHEASASVPARLNTRTRAVVPLIGFPPRDSKHWVLDEKLVPRAAIQTDVRGEGHVIVREGDQWKPAAPYDEYRALPGEWTPYAIDQQGRLLAMARTRDAAGTSAVFAFDPATGKLGDKPVFAIQGYDFQGALDREPGSAEILGLHYVSDAPGTMWFHPRMQALQKQVDAALPGLVTRIRCGRCTTESTMVVTAWSDRQSPLYFLLDTTKSGREALRLVAASRPWLDAERMAERDLQRFAARDGLAIPVHVTRPRGKGPFPTIVMVHGGPFVDRSHWRFDEEAQFLASRGYAVIEPDFRGTLGYGFKHYRAGWKQWGQAMQDDVTDATRWAVAQGIADPNRIAIAGASYGGYSALMGLIREPNLYRAAINWIGVTDIGLMYDIGWADFYANDNLVQTWMPARIGDPEKDRAMLDRNSPLKRAAEITKPVMMIYGTKDVRVPLPHGEKMRDALKAAGRVEVEWVVYEDEGHGFALVENNVDNWSRVERFLARHLK
jgi:dipeptidyl aminopeptidase/acylaminoacyl peptidase